MYGGTGNYERTESHFERVVMVKYDFCKVFNGKIWWVRTYIRNFMVFSVFYDDI
jgi:hypothetical protein